jgi:hypothetical protein
MNDDLDVTRFGEGDDTFFLRPVFEADTFDELEERFAHGERPKAWSEAGLWAMNEMRALLGDEWPSETARTGWFPAELGSAYSHTVAFARLMELALRLREFGSTSGMATVRNALKSDRTPQRWFHTAMQLEVAALAAASGADVKFEASEQGVYPADVRLTTSVGSLAIETFAVLTSERWRNAADASDAISARISGIENRYGVSCDVDFASETLQEDELARFLDEIEFGAAVVKAGQPIHVVRVQRASASVGRGIDTRFSGPPISENPWPRLAARVARKREQTRSSNEGVWLRVDLLDGIWQFSPWAQAPLAQKVEALALQLRQELGRDIGQVAGVIASSGSLLAQGRFTDETVRALDGSSGVRRVLAPVRVRETLVIPFGPESLPAGHFFRELYAEEAAWLDAALAKQDLGTIAEMFPRRA